MTMQRFLNTAVDDAPIVGDTTKRDGYFHSYVVILLAAGVLGLLLPIGLFVGEAAFLDAPVHARDSLSSYYHSPMRDFFVGSLCVIAVLLITYTWGSWHADFWASSIAGVCLLGVAFFPTERPNVPSAGPHCGDAGVAQPPGCTDLEQKWGEVTVGNIHLGLATIALVSLGLIAFIFSLSDKRSGKRRLARLHFALGCAIVAALLLVVVGQVHAFRIGGLTPLYIGEVVTVVAFGLGWLLRGGDLWKSGPLAHATRATTAT
jgi:hypothetical protein